MWCKLIEREKERQIELFEDTECLVNTIEEQHNDVIRWWPRKWKKKVQKRCFSKLTWYSAGTLNFACLTCQGDTLHQPEYLSG